MSSQSTFKGTFRVFLLVATCCVGSFLFAYDTGIIGGVLTLSAFQRDFKYSKHEKTTVASNSNSLLQAGAFFSCFAAWPFTARFGRRWSIALASLIFCLGAVIQTINTGHIAAFYVARVISGIGVGTATVIIPMFSAEMAPKKIRGQLGSMFQFFFTIGVCVSYWVNYGVSVGIPSSTRQWQVPIGLQLVPGGLLGLGMLYLPESVRWLAKRGDHEKAMKSLIWVRGGDSEAVREEMTEILAGLEAEARATEGFTWKEMLLPANRYRLFIAISLQIGVQLTGNTSLAYYAPEVFALAGAGNAKLLVSGFFGVIKVVSCGLFLIFLVDRVGRRWALIGGAFAMGSLMLIVAILTVLFPPSKTATSITPSGAASIAMIFLEAGAYNMSFGPVSWLYMSEIFPNRVREVGIAAGTATQWLFNFVFSQATPHAVNNLGWKTFLMFCIFNYALVAYGWFFIKETKGKSLEAMENLFGSKQTQIKEADLEHAKEEVVQMETKA